MELEAGCLNSEDWTPDWTVGLDRGTGLTESGTHPISKQHTHYYATVLLFTSHELNSGQMAITWYQYH